MNFVANSAVSNIRSFSVGAGFFYDTYLWCRGYLILIDWSKLLFGLKACGPCGDWRYIPLEALLWPELCFELESRERNFPAAAGETAKFASI